MNISSVKRSGKVKEAHIEAKDQRWHCRHRISLVFGSNHLEELDNYLYQGEKIVFQKINFHQAKNKAIEEIIDNCIDEYLKGLVTEIHIEVNAENDHITIQDNGLGIPLDKVEMVYSKFRTGSKFRDEEVDNRGRLTRTLGQNGLGAAATCLTSDIFMVTSRHYNSKNEQTFTFIDGALKIEKSKKKKFTGHSGVRVEFQLAKEVYHSSKIDQDFLRKRVIDLAYINPGLTFFFNGEQFLFTKGIIDLAQRIDQHAQLLSPLKYSYTLSKDNRELRGEIDIHIALVMQAASEERERFISFVNCTPTFDGGFHHDRIKRLFINIIKDQLEKVARRSKVTIVDNDILQGMIFVLSIVMPNPRFESQTKRKLVKDEYLDQAIEQLTKQFTSFLRKNKDFLPMVLDRAKNRTKFNELKEAHKLTKKQKKFRVDKLLDANERKHRDRCTLFICEGDSAIGGLRSARHKLYHGGIALKGKPMNVLQASISDILNNKEFSDIMLSIGLTIGVKADLNNLRYRRIVFLADSDVDGGHINTLLSNFFFAFWPELFSMGVICMAKAPLFEIICPNTRLYAESEEELELLKKKHKIVEIQRNKGLGEMSESAFKYILNKESYTTITTSDMVKCQEMINICFSKDSNLRKELLMDKE